MQTAGVVAFFMLLGELIESRTAAGARASIASLVKLTPPRRGGLLVVKRRRWQRLSLRLEIK